MLKFTEKTKNFIERCILTSRYLLVPMVFMLLIEILITTIDFAKVQLEMTETANLSGHMMRTLDLLDIMMVANLVWLISAGSYYVFIDNGTSGLATRERPRCLTHVSAGILKEKMAGSLIGVSSMHLLQTFLHIAESAEHVVWSSLGGMLAIHGIFIAGLLIFNRANAADHHNHKESRD